MALIRMFGRVASVCAAALVAVVVSCGPAGKLNGQPSVNPNATACSKYHAIGSPCYGPYRGFQLWFPPSFIPLAKHITSLNDPQFSAANHQFWLVDNAVDTYMNTLSFYSGYVDVPTGKTAYLYVLDDEKCRDYEPGQKSEVCVSHNGSVVQIIVWVGKNRELPTLFHALCHAFVVPNDKGHADTRWPLWNAIDDAIGKQLVTRP